MKKCCEFLRKQIMEKINYKKKNEVFNKRAAKIQKSIIFLKKNSKVNICKIKNILKLEIIVIIHDNIEVLNSAYLIYNIVYVNKFLSLFIMD